MGNMMTYKGEGKDSEDCESHFKDVRYEMDGTDERNEGSNQKNRQEDDDGIREKDR